MIGDLRNALQIEVARAKGGYLDSVPPSWIGDPEKWVEPKYDGIRITLQFDVTRNWTISRNRKDKLKGVDKAGDFVDWSDKLPHLCRELIVPKLAGVMFDGELVSAEDERGRGASVSTLMKENPRGLCYRVFDLLFDEAATDIRQLPLHRRRECYESLVTKLNSPFIKATPKLASTMEEIKKLWDDGWEGGIIKDGNSVYRQTNGMFKVKAATPVDAFVISVLQEKKGGSPKKGIKPVETGRAKGFLMGMKRRSDNKIQQVGWMIWNIPEKDQERGFKHFEKEYKGKVAEMTVSGYDGTSFRWCRFSRWRDDEPGSVKQCILEDQVGGMPVAAAEETE